MHLIITSVATPPPDDRPVEIVERKGIGHPDTICDAVAEEFSRALSGYYREWSGAILHHNVDKVLLRAGASSPRFGGGRVHLPMELYLAGRATTEVEGHPVPFGDLATEATRSWLRHNLHALDAVTHVTIHPLVRGGSPDLVELFRRQGEAGVWLANDTSCGVGHAPLSALERTVLEVERALTAPGTTRQHPACGEDVKVMGIRRGARVHLTLAAAVVDRFTPDIAGYRATTEWIAKRAGAVARAITGADVDVEVNAADRPERGEIYLTVTGTSAEGGDDGQAGRGNRVGGLITPDRPMIMESAAGKNPVSHVGKLYSVAATRIAEAVVSDEPDLAHAECFLVSRIGDPVKQPQLVELRVPRSGGGEPPLQRARLEEIVRRELDRLDDVWEEFAKGEVRLF